MINIIVYASPNYGRKPIINTSWKNEKIDLLSQFTMLCHSLKKNWHSFDYQVNLFHNKNIPFNKRDMDKLSKLDIDIFAVEPDYPKTPYMCRCNALTHAVKKPGSHRLLLDCDTLALNEPKFDLSCDWQAMYAGSVILPTHYEYINQKYGYNLNLKGKEEGNLFAKYMSGKSHKRFFPHFNAGAILLREELCHDFKRYTTPAYQISHDKKVPYLVRVIGVQYGASFALMKISKNWKPFERGFNFLGTSYSIEKFKKKNIKLLHYCGTNGEAVVFKHFKEYLR